MNYAVLIFVEKSFKPDSLALLPTPVDAPAQRLHREIFSTQVGALANSSTVTIMDRGQLGQVGCLQQHLARVYRVYIQQAIQSRPPPKCLGSPQLPKIGLGENCLVPLELKLVPPTQNGALVADYKQQMTSMHVPCSVSPQHPRVSIQFQDAILDQVPDRSWTPRHAFGVQEYR